ncbi:MAG: hypothetical protein RBR71_05865 [Gudongella sp.]|nr:hypothetical protein [Gudongella sp.]
MKSRKVVMLIAIVLGIALFSTGCAKKIEEKIGGKIVEKVIEKATGGEVDIDTNDGVSIEVEGGSMKTGDNLDWPKDSMMSLPKPKGNILSISEIKEQETTSVILNFDNENGGDAYLQDLLDTGYIQRSINKSEDFVMFTGYKEDNTVVMLSYQPNEEYGSITIIRNDETVKEILESETSDEVNEEPVEIDMEQSLEWPKDSMDNIPPINAQITNVSLSNEAVSISFENISKEDIYSYIEKVKSAGFDSDKVETEMVEYISYSAYNANGNTITVTWNVEAGSIYYIKQ